MTAVILLLSFLIGSVPNAYLIAKIFYGIDIRRYGSGNPGATNVWRVAGKIPGIITFTLDMLKGFIPAFIAKKIFIHDAALTIPMLAGLCAVAGHVWTPFLKFRGGKGVATGCGVFFGLVPVAAFFSFIIFFLALAITKYVAVGSITAAVAMPVFLYLLKRPPVLIYISVILAVIIIWRHKSNIKKILDKTEDK